jgi:copper chaperone CopZ
VLGRLPGVMQVKADHKTQRVNLMLDTDQVPEDQVREKLELAGFRAA